MCHLFAETGQPMMIEQWNSGCIDGPQIIFENGLQIAQVMYCQGKKEGEELRFKPGTDQVVAKISWHNDMRHGASIFIFPGQDITEWYWKDKKVSQAQFEAKCTLTPAF